MSKSEQGPTRKMILEDLHGYAREWARQDVNLPARVEIRLATSNRLHTSGKALIRNISLKGALLSKLVLKNQSLPVRPFYVSLSFNGTKYKGIGARCRPVRFGKGADFELAVEFDELWADEQIS